MMRIREIQFIVLDRATSDACKGRVLTLELAQPPEVILETPDERR